MHLKVSFWDVHRFHQAAKGVQVTKEVKKSWARWSLVGDVKEEIFGGTCWTSGPWKFFSTSDSVTITIQLPSITVILYWSKHNLDFSPQIWLEKTMSVASYWWILGYVNTYMCMYLPNLPNQYFYALFTHNVSFSSCFCVITTYFSSTSAHPSLNWPDGLTFVSSNFSN